MESKEQKKIGVVLSGGGARAAYQVGALKALIPYLKERAPVTVVTGTSVGAINGIVFASYLRHGLQIASDVLESVWRERTYKNTFRGSPSRAFFRAIQIAVLQYSSPGPRATSRAIFDPTPLMDRVDEVIKFAGGLAPEDRDPRLEAVAVMTTLEGEERKPLLFVSAKEKIPEKALWGASFDISYERQLTAAHAFASAALPSVLPPIQLNLETRQVRLVDGGIADNFPVDPALRLGADEIVLVDISGRRWWLDHFGKAHDTSDPWELVAKPGTFCLRPEHSLEVRNKRPFGPLLRDAVGRSTSDFISALGPTWPIFKILKNRMGEDLAYEVMSYVAIHPAYTAALIERGADDAELALK